ncbi:hypothetical protein J7369_22070 [Xanthomonas phaseoli pv. dieffenbachiae]|uniref:hypothetical protein n=1 Tax=Xanthomonas TaxID=338 RepID=UPI0006A4FD50|nr:MULTISPECIES: hypothetical protein [Xanthomonas]CAD7740289.1 hypothetical protein LMG31884_46480 [Xanthomonas hydrangeae]KOB39867.1 hypothetical protein AE931_20530 [Xanthomonas arboricola]MBO9900310.1 hypothetical protein [Xanthomonas phaseoli pv. dieffenbachiae]MCC8612800.1 hypothetical protein [Xanthomonas euvesicatoria pv. euvesicatoria]CAD7740293.1 hypothetical protein LMG31884_46480 [Xanthomonas hydrangeae]
MPVSNQQLDVFIDTSINRLSGESAPMRGRYIVDLRSFQQRITQKLVDECIAACRARGLSAERDGDSLFISVDLARCVMNERQSLNYTNALNHTRIVHGNTM